MDILLGYGGILLLIVCILLINKHIIGLPGYGFFYPLVMAFLLTNSLFASPWICIAVLASLVGWIIVNYTSKYIYILLYPKYSLYIISSLAVFMIITYLYLLYTPDSINPEQVMFILFGFVITTMSMQKIYNEGKGPLYIQRWLHIVRFLLLTWGASTLLQYDGLAILFTRHPWLLIIIACITIIIGSYTGLQAKEMIRFRKLIWAKITNKKGRTKS